MVEQKIRDTGKKSKNFALKSVITRKLQEGNRTNTAQLCAAERDTSRIASVRISPTSLASPGHPDTIATLLKIYGQMSMQNDPRA